jgi:[CysO sulfur-carrier protein]-S-L-cysteine hydrolase
MIIALREISFIKRQALEAYPEECCGIIVGRVERMNDKSLHNSVYRVAPCVNRFQGNKQMGFEIALYESHEIAIAAQEMGYDVLGTYHSHTTYGAFPSGSDCDHAKPNHSLLIVAVHEKVIKEIRSFRRTTTSKEIHEEPVHIRF